MLELKGLTRQELVDKLAILSTAINTNVPDGELRFGLKVSWNIDGMTIIIGVE